MSEFLPFDFFLSQNYPNPFREKTIIKYCVPLRTRIQITVFNADGDIIKKLIDEVKDPGAYEVEFNIVEMHPDDSVQSETYFYKLEAGEFKCEKRMELIK